MGTSSEFDLYHLFTCSGQALICFTTMLSFLRVQAEIFFPPPLSGSVENKEG